jgi:hypothetical protein
VQKKTLTAILVPTILLSLLCGYYVAPMFVPKRYLDAVVIAYETSEGKGFLEMHNLITNIGENQSRTRMAVGNTYVELKYISLGNATVVAAETQLDAQYSTRITGTVTTDLSYLAHSSFNVTTNKYTFTETVYINATGAHWAASGDNNMYAIAALQGGTMLQWNANDNITITWVFSFSYG